MINYQYIFILIVVFSLNLQAQTIIVPIGSGDYYELTPEYYLKDVNNDFNKFEGTWVYQNGKTEITLKLKKEELFQVSSDRDYQDLLVGEYQYILNELEIVNTLSDFDNPTVSGYSHIISGGVFKYTLPSHCTDNSDISEIKISLFIGHPTQEYTEGYIIMRYVEDNGVEKIEACIYDNTTMGGIQNARIDIPNGYYEFIKQE